MSKNGLVFPMFLKEKLNCIDHFIYDWHLRGISARRIKLDFVGMKCNEIGKWEAYSHRAGFLSKKQEIRETPAISTAGKSRSISEQNRRNSQAEGHKSQHWRPFTLPLQTRQPGRKPVSGGKCFRPCCDCKGCSSDCCSSTIYLSALYLTILTVSLMQDRLAFHLLRRRRVFFTNRSRRCD